jgi:hypothetical protein
MCVHKSLVQPQLTGFDSCSTTDFPSTPEGKNSTYPDGKFYSLETDIRTGYHMVMPLNASYDNVSNQRFVSRSVRLGAVPRRQYDSMCYSDGGIEVGRF